MKTSTFDFKPYYFYLITLAVYFICVGTFVVFFEKGQPELWINQFNNPVLDFFFKYYTNVGDGWFFMIFNILLLFVGFYESLIALISILITTVFIQYFKLSLFNQAPRPKAYLPKDLAIHYVDGLEIHLHNTFPSGHTSTAMCMAMIMVFILLKYVTRNQKVWITIIFFACFLVGFSRVYLMQHFVLDTLAGTFLGTLIAFLVIYIFEKYTRLNTNSFWSRSLLRLKK